MSLTEYVIGGMDLDFKLKLYHALSRDGRRGALARHNKCIP